MKKNLLTAVFVGAVSLGIPCIASAQKFECVWVETIVDSQGNRLPSMYFCTSDDGHAWMMRG